MSDVCKSQLFKAVRDYEGEKIINDGEHHLTLLKGDILIDCEVIDKDWFRGKVITTDVYGKIPRSYVVQFDSNYEDIDERSVTSPINITKNPLCDEEEDTGRDKRSLSQFNNYVDMSSDESINNAEKRAMIPNTDVSIENVVKEPVPQKITGKTSDEGYNSSSHYSGETQESDKPVDSSETPLVHHNIQDEAGYEVPSICFRESPPPSIKRKEKKRKSLKSLLRVKSLNKSFIEAEVDEAREQYYDPPVDQSDGNFLPLNSFFTLRILLSFIAAISMFLMLFLVLLLVCHTHVLLSFSLALVVFFIVLIFPVTLSRNHIACVFTLLLPSLASTKNKIAILLLLLVLLLIGPILGIVNKLDTASFCAGELKNDTVMAGLKATSATFSGDPNQDIAQKISRIQAPIEKDCVKSFTKVQEYCIAIHSRFKQVCERHKQLLSQTEAGICEKDEKSFCFSNKTLLEEICHPAKQLPLLTTRKPIDKTEPSISKLTKYLRGKRNENIDLVRNYLLYITPLLILLVFWDTYNYNTLYLTTKANDNIYITRRIKELDLERQNRGLTDFIIPLTRIEFQSYLLRTSLSLSKVEQRSLLKWLFIWVLCLVGTQLVILLEDSIDAVLIVSQTDPCIWYYRATTDKHYRVILYILLGVFVLMILLQSYILRLRSVICDYFYPDMIDTRSKYLYYKILHDRNTFSKRLKRKVQLLSEEKRLLSRISYLAVLRKSFPLTIQNSLKKARVAKCMICDSLTRRVIECKNIHCQAHFCFECYVDAGQTCLICRNREKDI